MTARRCGLFLEAGGNNSRTILTLGAQFSGTGVDALPGFPYTPFSHPARRSFPAQIRGHAVK
jgi:hypothetical protein